MSHVVTDNCIKCKYMDCVVGKDRSARDHCAIAMLVARAAFLPKGQKDNEVMGLTLAILSTIAFDRFHKSLQKSPYMRRVQ